MDINRTKFLALAGAGAGSLAAAPAGARSPDGSIRFVYASDFWTNLHHRLHVEAALADFVVRGHKPTRQRSLALLADRERMSAEQRTVWDAALQTYLGEGFSKRSLLFDDGMTEIKEALTGRARSDGLTSPAISDPLRHALVSAAPVYEVTTWPADDAANRAWIADAQPRVAAHGAELTRRLSRLYRWPWPLGDYRVDIVRYLDLYNAYTTSGPIHTVMASTGSSGTSALEMLFHEASHAVIAPDIGTIGTAIQNAAVECGRREPANFWHGVIFYTVGSAVAETVLRATGERYSMYADANDLWARGWTAFRKPLVQHWQPYMDGNGSMQESMTATVRAVLDGGA